MSIYNSILNLLNKDYRSDVFTQDLTSAIALWLEKFKNKIIEVINNFFFDSLNIDGCEYFEKALDIEPKGDITNRRSSIQAKWLSSNHNCIQLIQNVCNAWKDGEALADFINGKILIKFIGAYGIPDGLEYIKNCIETIKPAHIGYGFEFKRLRKKEIHNVLTKKEMQTYKKSQYCDVKTEKG